MYIARPLDRLNSLVFLLLHFIPDPFLLQPHAPEVPCHHIKGLRVVAQDPDIFAE